MAILSKIRERSMFLIIIIGLALFAFVLDPSTLTDFFNSNKIDEIGEVNGESISRQEFAEELEKYQQQTGGRVSEMQASNAVWNNIIRKKIYENQLAEAGITIGEEDNWNNLISQPSVNNNPQFQNEAGLFDETKFKQFLADIKENNKEMWAAWSNYMNQLRDNAQINTYNNLVTAGLGASLKEGENQYFIDNTKINAQFVYVPYTSVADSLVKIKKSEVEAYVKDHSEEFKVDASRDLLYVKFDITATPEDEAAIKSNVASLIDDSDDNGVKILGLKNTSDYEEFLSENDSDTQLNSNFQYKNFINNDISDKIFEAKKGEVVGPYKDKGFFKISKVTEVSEMPDSVKANHILIPFIGTQRANPEITRTKEQAKKLADSIVKVVKRNKSKFSDLAKEYSSDKSNSDKGGELDWFNYNRMTPAFRDFTFTNKKGTIDVVETPFGYHVVEIVGQKNIQKVVKLVTYGKKIIPSEATENATYRKAQQFVLELTNGKTYDAAVKENKFISKPAVGIKALDENVPGLGNQRQIVSWAFRKDAKIGDFKQFDTEGSYIVSYLSGITKEGLMNAEKATGRVRPILVNQKKAAIIKEKMNGTNLQELAKSNSTTVRTANGVTLKSPTLSGVGFEPKVVGAMYNAEANKFYNKIEGSRGVYAFTVIKKELPTVLPNYETTRKKIAQDRKRLTYKVYEAIKKASGVEDNREKMYTAN